MSDVMEQCNLPALLSISNLRFSLDSSVAMVKRQVNDLLLLPVVQKQLRAGK